MDLRRACNLTVLLLSLFFAHYKVISGDSTVVFLDSPTHQYLRQSSSQSGSFSPSEISAAASVLLGFAPYPTVTAASSSKLNEVLMPNPFDRPRALLLLEVTGAEEFELVADKGESPLSGALRIKVAGNERADIQLIGEDEVSLVSLNEGSSVTECSDKELSEFASWMGGSYIEDKSRPLHGELILPTSNGSFMRLHLSERADMEFATSLMLLVNKIKHAKKIHQVFTKNEISPAELFTGRFDGIKALQDNYGKEGIAQSGLEVFVNSISKAVNLIQSVYQGQIVGIIAHGDQLGFQVKLNSQRSARQLAETETSPDIAKLAEVLFVRRALAWITGIILLIATLLGILFLMNMPLTKDTLLYSNVKLD
ncbi:putative type 1 membrane protein [Striga hermonthica]|uniref:Type 1 membrane protein n=1 Tax=Striga hermonthica TaxID=68872 RepID=A0A9N7MVR9_STRHE|nr:putative type 1 membrane protein [Striga hermonthica]